MKKVNWDDLPDLFKDELRTIDEEHTCFRKITIELETMLLTKFSIPIQVTCRTSGNFYQDFDFVFKDTDYTFILLKYF